MKVAPILEKAFSRIYGKPCWCVRPGYGSFLTIEFGTPHLEVREPIVASKGASAKVRKALARRSVSPHGKWHLWIYCCDWELLSKGKRIANSSRRITIRRAADVLNGQKLARFSISPRKILCTFEFDLGAILTTRPFDKKSEQWLLYGPRHRVLVVRADGRYKYQRSHEREDSGKWKPIQIRAS
jgi:hypothetical protein